MIALKILLSARLRQIRFGSVKDIIISKKNLCQVLKSTHFIRCEYFQKKKENVDSIIFLLCSSEKITSNPKKVSLNKEMFIVTAFSRYLIIPGSIFWNAFSKLLPHEYYQTSKSNVSIHFQNHNILKYYSFLSTQHWSWPTGCPLCDVLVVPSLEDKWPYFLFLFNTLWRIR